MRMVATVVGGGLLALLGLAIVKAAMGGLLALAAFVGGLLLKVALAVVLVWLAVRLLKTLVRPPHQEA